ncbi:MAG: sulfite exporter TauE/SafE family protein [Acidimicrobiales bacterium]
MTPAQQALVAAAGFVAGGINGIAGGGSLVSFPALLAVGLPALAANVTSTVGIWPGYLGGVVGFRSEVADQGDRIRSLLPTTLGGAAVGAALLLTTPAGAFAALAPFLVLLACGLFAAQPLLTRRMAPPPADDGTQPPAPPSRGRRQLVLAASFASAVYGAYFGAGLGVMLLAVLGTLVPDDLVRTSSLRGALSLIINTVAAGLFLVAAPVAWAPAGLLAGGALIGGFAGARLARRVPALVLRAVVITIGVLGALRLLLG